MKKEKKKCQDSFFLHLHFHNFTIQKLNHFNYVIQQNFFYLKNIFWFTRKLFWIFIYKIPNLKRQNRKFFTWDAGKKVMIPDVSANSDWISYNFTQVNNYFSYFLIHYPLFSNFSFSLKFKEPWLCFSISFKFPFNPPASFDLSWTLGNSACKWRLNFKLF